MQAGRIPGSAPLLEPKLEVRERLCVGIRDLDLVHGEAPVDAVAQTSLAEEQDEWITELRRVVVRRSGGELLSGVRPESSRPVVPAVAIRVRASTEDLIQGAAEGGIGIGRVVVVRPSQSKVVAFITLQVQRRPSLNTSALKPRGQFLASREPHNQPCELRAATT